MGIILIAAGWLIALFCTWVTVSALAVAWRHVAKARHRSGMRHAPGWPGVPLTWGCAALSAFTVLGVLPVLAGAVLAALTAAVLLVPLARVWVMAVRRGAGGEVARRILRGLAGNVRVGARYPQWDIAALIARMRGSDEPDGVPAPPPAADRGTRAVPVTRVIPSIRDDETIGAAPAAADVAAGLAGAGVPVPPAWAALCESVSSHEPDTDEDELAFIAGHAAGHLAYADAWRARAENLQHGTGLDPAYVAGNFEFADEVGESASALAMVSHRFHVVYGAVRSWIAGGGVLPNNGRWLTGDGGSAQQDDGEAAA